MRILLYIYKYTRVNFESYVVQSSIDLMNEYLFTEYLINIQKDIQKLYVAYIKNILITTILNI